ncbi:MAG: ABC transporter permease [Oscillospiraceae bacterium]|jgi:putative ABC transport system permease protein|nr:ABC transporter permease [Oscillospiraceae bacterium]
MKFEQAVKMAVKSIRSNKMRSFLTILGIVIGISSVIILIGIGSGSKETITSAIEGMGTNLLTVSLTGSDAASLTDSELKTIRSYASVSDAVPDLTGTATAKAGSESYTTAVEGTLPGYENVRSVHAALGRFLTQDDDDNRYRVADVGVEVLQNLYPDMDSSEYETLIGKNISLNGTDFEIAGILESKGTSSAGSSDNRVLIPLSTAERFLKNKEVKTYYVAAKTSDDISLASAELNRFFLQKYDSDSSQFRILSQTELLETSSSTVGTLTMMLAGIAAISLLVGGIGIMNIMLVSVVERTREIGIRKAVGARRKDILLQFVIEAIFISCVGGLAGIGIGVLAGVLIQVFSSMKVALSVPVMMAAFGFSAAVGIIFGLYPAAKASKLKPIDALSFE